MNKFTLASLLLGLGIAATPGVMADTHRDRDYRGDRHERLERLERQERHERQEHRREFRKERREHRQESAGRVSHFGQRHFDPAPAGPRFRDRHDRKHYQREHRRAERHAWKHAKRQQRRAWKHYRKHHQPHSYGGGYGRGYYPHRIHHDHAAGAYSHHSGRHDSTLPIIAGGVIGGLVGSDLGHGDPGAATRGLVVGSVLGYALTR